MGVTVIVPKDSASAQALPPTTGVGLTESHAFRGFIENQGQWPTEVLFVAQLGHLLVRAESKSIVLQVNGLLGEEPKLGIARLVFESSEGAQPVGVDRQLGDFNYFVGRDPSGWRRHVGAFAGIVFPEVAPGIAIRLYESHGQLEYDLELAANADLDQLSFRFEGISGLCIRPDGSMRGDTALGPIIQSAPRAGQILPSGESLVATCRFQIDGGNRFRFIATDRLAGSKLVIDPGLTWATFLGGSSADHADQVEALAGGDLLILGRSASANFPTTAGVYSRSWTGSTDLTITRMSAGGDALVFSTYLGGSGSEVASFAVSDDERIAIAGSTTSIDYPTLPDAYDTTFNGPGFDAFATILQPDGSDLLLSTLVGGACGQFFTGVGFTASGLVVATGSTCSEDFPVTASAFDMSHNGMADGVICWLDHSQAGEDQLVCSSFFGGSGEDQVKALSMVPGDDPVIVGLSSSAVLPTTPGAYDETPGGNFITRFAADGTTLSASTRFKGGDPWRIETDGSAVLIAGNPDFDLPVPPGAYDSSWNGQSDCFVARLDGSLTRVLAATYLGGSRNEFPSGLAIDASGDIIIAGRTQSDDYPTTLGAYDTVKGGIVGSTTTMISRLSSDLSELRYSSFLGPALAAASWANDVTTLGPADVVIVGEGAQTGFPVTPGAFDDTFNGGSLGGADGYVAHMLLEPLTWYSLGGAVPGSIGTPALAGSGDLIVGQPVTLTLTNAKPAASATLIVGLSLLEAPFKGGTLVPNPALTIFGLAANGHGTLALTATWPAGLPSGFSFYTQYWIVDAAGPAGFAASNGLAGNTP